MLELVFSFVMAQQKHGLTERALMLQINLLKSTLEMVWATSS